jgi:hypothetical protein
MALLVWERPHDEDGGGKRLLLLLLLFSECLSRGKKKSDADPAEAEIRHVDFRTGLLCEGWREGIGRVRHRQARKFTRRVSLVQRSLLVKVLRPKEFRYFVHHGRTGKLDYSNQPTGAAMLRR